MHVDAVDKQEYQRQMKCNKQPHKACTSSLQCTPMSRAKLHLNVCSHLQRHPSLTSCISQHLVSSLVSQQSRGIPVISQRCTSSVCQFDGSVSSSRFVRLLVQNGSKCCVKVVGRRTTRKICSPCKDKDTAHATAHLSIPMRRHSLLTNAPYLLLCTPCYANWMGQDRLFQRRCTGASAGSGC